MHFPRSHLFLVGFMTLGLTSFGVAKFSDNNAGQRLNADTTLATLKEVEATPVLEPLAVLTSTAEDTIAFSEPLAIIEPPKPRWREVSTKVKQGDNLALIFKRQKLSPRDVHAVSTSQPLGKRLRNIYPGHDIRFFFDSDDQLMALHYKPGPLVTLIYEREGDAFASRQENEEPIRVLAYKHGTIDHSLFVASQRAGLTDALTMRLAQIFQWDVDFVLDIRPGDEFYVLFEELYHNEELIGHGEILAAEFINQGEHYRAIQYVDEEGDKDYFSPSGESMRKAFLRAPVEFSRISSNFNLRRVHPLFKTVRPHRGIDYAAPRGTPILAAGDGRVERATRTKANGNFVVIQHGEQFVTKYLHLSKFGRGIKRGARVNQGQVIGYVGATGWATAPHLHYEFLVNGVHKNPRTVSLPDAEPIPQQEMMRFQSHIHQYALLLDNYKDQINIASAR